MVAAPVHASIEAAACPSKALRPIFEKFGFVPFVFCFKHLFKIVRLLDGALTPARSLLGTVPSDELEFAFVQAAVSAFPMLIVPDHALSAGSFMARPICFLAFYSTIVTIVTATASLDFDCVALCFSTHRAST